MVVAWFTVPSDVTVVLISFRKNNYGQDNFVFLFFFFFSFHFADGMMRYSAVDGLKKGTVYLTPISPSEARIDR